MTTSDLIKIYRRTRNVSKVVDELVYELSTRVSTPEKLKNGWLEAESKWESFAKQMDFPVTLFQDVVFQRIPRLEELTRGYRHEHHRAIAAS